MYLLPMNHVIYLLVPDLFLFLQFEMKNYLIKLLLNVFMDKLIQSLHLLSRQSDSGIDDLIVGAVMADRNKIIDDIKANL